MLLVLILEIRLAQQAVIELIFEVFEALQLHLDLVCAQFVLLLYASSLPKEAFHEDDLGLYAFKSSHLLVQSIEDLAQLLLHLLARLNAASKHASDLARVSFSALPIDRISPHE